MFRKRDSWKIKSYTVSAKDVLGCGAYGVIYRAEKGIFKKKVAAKQIDGEKHPRVLTQDLGRLKNLTHKNIAEIFDIHHMQKEKIVWMFMELCHHGDLDTFFRKKTFTLRMGLDVMTQSASAIEYLHSQNVIHRDIKPADILIGQDMPLIIKVTDFEVSKFLNANYETSAMSSNVGTEAFKVPEFFQRSDKKKISYHRNVDTFALGLTCLAMLQAKPGKGLVPHTETTQDYSELNLIPIGKVIADRVKYKSGELNIINVTDDTGAVSARNETKKLIRQMTCITPTDRLLATAVVQSFETIIREYDEMIDEPLMTEHHKSTGDQITGNENSKEGLSQSDPISAPAEDTNELSFGEIDTRRTTGRTDEIVYLRTEHLSREADTRTDNPVYSRTEVELLPGETDTRRTDEPVCSGTEDELLSGEADTRGSGKPVYSRREDKLLSGETDTRRTDEPVFSKTEDELLSGEANTGRTDEPVYLSREDELPSGEADTRGSDEPVYSRRKDELPSGEADTRTDEPVYSRREDELLSGEANTGRTDEPVHFRTEDKLLFGGTDTRTDETICLRTEDELPSGEADTRGYGEPVYSRTEDELLSGEADTRRTDEPVYSRTEDELLSREADTRTDEPVYLQRKGELLSGETDTGRTDESVYSRTEDELLSREADTRTDEPVYSRTEDELLSGEADTGRTDEPVYLTTEDELLFREADTVRTCERLKSQNRVSKELKADWQTWQSCKQLHCL